MAMRPRGGGSATPRRGARSGVVRPVYEDFKPMSEWQQDDESHILNIYLPGFMKEQIKVSTEGKNTVRVRGERLVAGNKWSRFSEDFQVPENGEMNSVRAKFQGGTLNITVPKKEVHKPHQEPPLPPVHMKGQDKVLTEVSSSQQQTENHEKISSLEPEKTSVDPRAEKGYQHVDDQKQPKPQKISTDARKEHDHHPETDEKNKSSDNQSKEENIIASEKPDVHHETKILEKDHNKESYGGLAKEKYKKAVKGLAELSEEVKKTVHHETKILEKNHNKESYGGLAKEKYNKAVKGLAELGEERQLLVNMGVALLVIVALTAHVTYKFASGKDKN